MNGVDLADHDQARDHTEGLRRRILLAPVNSVAEIAADEQLKAQNFSFPLLPAIQPHNPDHAQAIAKLSLTRSGRHHGRRVANTIKTFTERCSV